MAPEPPNVRSAAAEPWRCSGVVALEIVGFAAPVDPVRRAGEGEADGSRTGGDVGVVGGAWRTVGCGARAGGTGGRASRRLRRTAFEMVRISTMTPRQAMAAS